MIIKPAERTNKVREYYFSQKLAQIEMMRIDGADVINLGIGSPDQPPSKATVDALVSEARKEGSHGYQSYTGIPALRQALSKWYKRYFNVELDPAKEILPLMGSKEGIMHISLAFINTGDEVLVPDPGYPTYTSVTELVGGVVRKFDLKEENGWEPDIEALEKQDLSKVKLMWVNYPNMPTGAKATSELFEKLVKFTNAHNILLCNDNPYSFILNKDHRSILATKGAMENVLELNSLSKSHNMAGWRVGMVAGGSEYIKTILKVKSNMDSGMFLGLQKAAVEALSNPDSWLDDVNTVYFRRRIIVEDIMKMLDCSFDRAQSGLFVWGKIPAGIPDCEGFVEDILNKAKVFITPGFIFGKNGERYIRISLCATENRLREAKERIALTDLSPNPSPGEGGA
jgi:aspartate/methionine/tyrosine aminotransferase